MNHIRSVEAIYDGAVLVERDGAYVCPVCSKEYKQQKAAQKHLDQQNCHSVYDIFGNTEYEKKAFLFYSNIQAQKNHKMRPTIKSFRKSSLYKNSVMYLVSCMANDVDHGLMYSFLEEIVGVSYPNAIMKKAQDMKWVIAYRSFIHNHPEISDSKEYYEQYKDVLLEDDDFLIQSIEKAHISIGFIEKRPKLLDAVEALPVGYRMRLLDVCKTAEESDW